MKCDFCLSRENQLMIIWNDISNKIKNLMDEPYLGTPGSKTLSSYCVQQEEVMKTYCALTQKECEHPKT